MLIHHISPINWFWSSASVFNLRSLLWRQTVRLKPTCCSCAVISHTRASRASVCRVRSDVRGVCLWVGEREGWCFYMTRRDARARAHARKTEGMENLARNPRPLSIHHMVGESRPGGIEIVCVCVRARALVYSLITSTQLWGSRDKTSICISSLIPHLSYSRLTCTHACAQWSHTWAVSWLLM